MQRCLPRCSLLTPLCPRMIPRWRAAVSAGAAPAAHEGDVEGEDAAAAHAGQISALAQPAALKKEAAGIGAADPGVTDVLHEAEPAAATAVLASEGDAGPIAAAGAADASAEANADDSEKDPVAVAVSSGDPSGDNFADAHSSQGEDGFHDAEDGQSKTPTPAGNSPTVSDA